MMRFFGLFVFESSLKTHSGNSWGAVPTSGKFACHMCRWSHLVLPPGLMQWAAAYVIDPSSQGPIEVRVHFRMRSGVAVS